MGKLVTDDARKIGKKLGATIVTNRKAHDLAEIRHNGILVAAFGIRRGSGKSIGHDHICSELQMNRHDCHRLADCTLSREEWIERMIEAGVIDDAPTG